MRRSFPHTNPKEPKYCGSCGFWFGLMDRAPAKCPRCRYPIFNPTTGKDGQQHG